MISENALKGFIAMRFTKLFFISILTLSLFGCATVDATKQKAENNVTRSHAVKKTNTTYKATDPKTVSVNTVPAQKYKKIGEVYVNRYNLWGNKRQVGVIYDLMQKQAAHVGGNAVIDIKKNNKLAMGTIVRFAQAT